VTTTAAPGLFTVVVPTHGRAHSLRRLLDALAAQTLPRQAWDVIVVDDGSPQDLAPVVAPLRGVLRFELIRRERSGPAAARNAGAAAAQGRYLAFTDDDCTPAPGWLEALARAFERLPQHMLGGSTINAVSGNPYSAVSQAVIAYLYDYFNAEGGVRFLTSNNMAVPAGRFHAMGGFSEDWFRLAAAEDRDLCERWQDAGNAIAFVPDAIVEHHHILSFRTFWRQHFHYGRGARRFHCARAARGRSPLRVEPLRFYLGLVGYPLQRNPPLRGAHQAALMAVTQLAHAAGYFYETAAQSRPVDDAN
jgi:GT2 family glycosyltransferase